jgi:chromosome segregation protein
VRAETEEAVAEITRTVAGERTRVDDLNASLKKIRAEVSKARDNRGNIEIEHARLSAELDYLRESCNSELNISLDELLASKPAELSEGVQVASDEMDGEDAIVSTDDADASLQNSKERLEYLRRKLDEIGPVNLLAIEEMAEAQQRYDFLTSQRKDILDSIASTEEALNEIKRRSRQRFREAFAAINTNFIQLFVELFGGGRGEMTLLEDEDILEAGIDIIAQPPGKRLQNVLLLSGGEKAMTALALTLAIFRYRPSPFCVLDEVDAPLDEVNTGRFCDKILQMSEETQFLVITHTKRTMEAARALYGVTMEEPGISKLLSVRFE